MRYLSIDIETTGLNPEKCQILEFAAVLDDTDKVCKISELPRLHLRFNLGEGFYGEPYALNLNGALIQKIFKKDDTECKIVDNRQLNILIKNFIDLYIPYTDNVVVAGKNFHGFDKKFLDKIDTFTGVKLSHRCIDPTVLFWQFADKELPSSEKCYSRAGLVEDVKHTALEDVIGIIKLVRRGLKLPDLLEG
jgi:oligoribonuclease (3'-5' exoribonuclease)